jgi:hypothetical protein
MVSVIDSKDRIFVYAQLHIDNNPPVISLYVSRFTGMTSGIGKFHKLYPAAQTVSIFNKLKLTSLHDFFINRLDYYHRGTVA